MKNDNLYKVIDLIEEGEYDLAYDLSKRVNMKLLSRKIIDRSISTESFSFLDFAFFRLAKKETAAIHIEIAEMLMMAYCYYCDAYETAYYHIKRAMKLEPYNTANQEALLELYNNSDGVLSQKEALKIAKEVIKRKPYSRCAKKILSNNVYYHKG